MFVLQLRIVTASYSDRGPWFLTWQCNIPLHTRSNCISRRNQRVMIFPTTSTVLKSSVSLSSVTSMTWTVKERRIKYTFGRIHILRATTLQLRNKINLLLFTIKWAYSVDFGVHWCSQIFENSNFLHCKNDPGPIFGIESTVEWSIKDHHLGNLYTLYFITHVSLLNSCDILRSQFLSRVSECLSSKHSLFWVIRCDGDWSITSKLPIIFEENCHTQSASKHKHHQSRMSL